MSAVACAPARPSLDLRAIGVMILLCAIWGFQQVAIKSATHAIPPMLQAGLRSAIAAVGVWAWRARAARRSSARTAR